MSASLERIVATTMQCVRTQLEAMNAIVNLDISVMDAYALVSFWYI